MKNKKLYKFLREGLKSDSGDHTWTLGKWYKINGKLEICHNGFHASKTALQALGYVKGEILAEVEVRGKSVVEDDKECWSEMRVVKAYKWQKKDSVSLAIYAAELVIDFYEKKYPKDDRPRKAIEAAKAYLVAAKNGDKDAAARAAYAAAAAANAGPYPAPPAPAAPGAPPRPRPRLDARSGAGRRLLPPAR